MDSLADECRRHCLEGKEFGSRGGIKYQKKEENATIRQRHCHETDVDDKTVHHNFTCQLTS